MSDEQNTVTDEEIESNTNELSEDDLDKVSGGGTMKSLDQIKS